MGAAKARAEREGRPGGGEERNVHTNGSHPCAHKSTKRRVSTGTSKCGHPGHSHSRRYDGSHAANKHVATIKQDAE